MEVWELQLYFYPSARGFKKKKNLKVEETPALRQTSLLYVRTSPVAPRPQGSKFVAVYAYIYLGTGPRRWCFDPETRTKALLLLVVGGSERNVKKMKTPCLPIVYFLIGVFFILGFFCVSPLSSPISSNNYVAPFQFPLRTGTGFAPEVDIYVRPSPKRYFAGVLDQVLVYLVPSA